MRQKHVPKLLRLPRSVATELVLLAVLMPLAIADLGALYYPKVFATNPSSMKGAICWAKLPQRVLQVLWKRCMSKGSYTRILSPAEVVLRSNGLLARFSVAMPERPLAYKFDFLEIFSALA